MGVITIFVISLLLTLVLSYLYGKGKLHEGIQGALGGAFIGVSVVALMTTFPGTNFVSGGGGGSSGSSVNGSIGNIQHQKLAELRRQIRKEAKIIT